MLTIKELNEMDKEQFDNYFTREVKKLELLGKDSDQQIHLDDNNFIYKQGNKYVYAIINPIGNMSILKYAQSVKIFLREYKDKLGINLYNKQSLLIHGLETMLGDVSINLSDFNRVQYISEPLWTSSNKADNSELNNINIIYNGEKVGELSAVASSDSIKTYIKGYRVPYSRITVTPCELDTEGMVYDIMNKHNIDNIDKTMLEGKSYYFIINNDSIDIGICAQYNRRRKYGVKIDELRELIGNLAKNNEQASTGDKIYTVKVAKVVSGLQSALNGVYSIRNELKALAKSVLIEGSDMDELLSNDYLVELMLSKN